MTQARSAIVRFVFDNSLLLLVGTLAAVVWADVDVVTYDSIAHPLHFWINDVGMVFFFALAAKEVFEATLPGGALASGRQAMSPLAAAVGEWWHWQRSMLRRHDARTVVRFVATGWEVLQIS